MNILYYFWGENCKNDMIDSLREQGHSVYVTDSLLPDYDNALACAKIFEPLLDRHAIDFIFSFNYFPAISRFAHDKKLRYVSWVYDCPHLTLYSVTISNPENFIFLFDLNLCDLVRRLGAVNVFHLPLAFNDTRLENQLQKINDTPYEISFVGSLYSQAVFDNFPPLPTVLSSSLQELISAQRQVWGQDLVSEFLTESVVSELNSHISFSPLPGYMFTNRDLYYDIIQKKITSLDRVSLLTAAASRHNLSLFTAPAEKLPAGITNMGYVDYCTVMPAVFKKSKINLNISLRSITSGIPLRGIDILGAGGFLLTNYQPEFGQYLIPGEDYACFTGEDEFLSLIDYYLEHENERREVAKNGHRKALQLFSYRHAIAEIMKTIRES